MIQAPITLLVVTAVEAERDAIADAIADELSRPTARAATIQLLIGGVGPAAAAATNADAQARLAAAGTRPDVVLCAGIGGGFAPTVLGEVVVASSVVFADLGAETPAGFTELAQLGFGRNHYPVPARVAAELSGRTGARAGTILTVSTVTGSAATAHQLRLRYPDAVAEAMEGAGVAAAGASSFFPQPAMETASNDATSRVFFMDGS